MNKKLLALAVAGAMTAPMVAQAAPDTVLYGSVRTHLQNVDAGGADQWEVTQGASRLGVKGAEDLGGGLQAVYNMEFNIDTDTAVGVAGGRPMVVGLKGDFGQITLGNQWSEYYLAVGSTTDIFNGASNIFSASAGTPAHIGAVGGSRIADTAVYKNTFGPVKLGVQLIMNSAATAEDFDGYVVGASFPAGPVMVGLGMVTDNVGSGGDHSGVSVKWSAGALGVGFKWESGDLATPGSDVDNLGLNVQFKTGNELFMAQFESTESDITTDQDADAMILAWQHNFSKRTRAFVEFASAESTTVGAADTDTTSIGFRHDF